MPIEQNDVGAFATGNAGGFSLRFGVYLPDVQPADGFEVLVRIIHQADRFDPNVQTVDVPLQWQQGSALDLWSVTTALSLDPQSHFGLPGVYLYRFQLWQTPAGDQRRLISRWFTDPFARQTDVGLLAAVTCGDQGAFAWSDAAWATPELDDLIVYELHVDQFNNSFQGIADRLPYLKGLGVNCLELMPVTSTKLDYDWGYGPVHYFAPSAVFGGPLGLQQLVDTCHAQGVAVILDVVYQHVDPAFAYHQVYTDIAKAGITGIASPMIGDDGDFGPKVDFSKDFAQEFFETANRRWMDEYHVDGFRYDEVTDLYMSATDTGYAKLAYETYLYSQTMPRFGCGPGTWSRIIQAAEALSIAPTVLRSTYTNAAWQDDLLNIAESIAAGNLDAGSLATLAHCVDPFFMGKYPDTKSVVDSTGQAVEMPVAPFQYINSHDHSHLICSAGTTGDGPLPSGNRDLFYKLQPLAVALYTCQGVPMLWEGEELCDNYMLAGAGSARINLRRDVHWSYFYDDDGVPLVRLYRTLGKLRSSTPALRSRHTFFYFQESLQGNSVLAYHRFAPAAGTVPEQYAMVVLNFGSESASITLPFPKAGTWTERVDAETHAAGITVANDGDRQTVTVPSSYGHVYVL